MKPPAVVVPSSGVRCMAEIDSKKGDHVFIGSDRRRAPRSIAEGWICPRIGTDVWQHPQDSLSAPASRLQAADARESTTGSAQRAPLHRNPPRLAWFFCPSARPEAGWHFSRGASPHGHPTKAVRNSRKTHRTKTGGKSSQGASCSSPAARRCSPRDLSARALRLAHCLGTVAARCGCVCAVCVWLPVCRAVR